MKRIITYLIIMALLLPLCACGEAGQVTVPETVEDLRESGELVLYQPNDDYGIYPTAIRAFKKKYPNVTVTVEEIDGALYEETYTKRLSTELMAGKGPDVVYMSWATFPDVYKVIDNKALLNLQGVVESDPEFPGEELVSALLEAGKYKDGHYLFPFSYSVPSLLSTEETLADLGLSELIDEQAGEEFWTKLVEKLPALWKQPSLKAVIPRMTDRMLLDASGVSLYDRETGEILPDEEGLEALTRVYKALVYDYPNSLNDDIETTMDPLKSGLEERAFAFGYTGNYHAIEYLAACLPYQKAAGTPVTMPMVGMDGKVHAWVGPTVAVNAASKNSRNAWNFVKLLFSQEVQDQGVGMEGRKDSTRRELDQWRQMIQGEPDAFSEEEMEEYLDFVLNPDDCVIHENYLWDFYLEAMEPYFTGKSDYQSCLAVLRDRITIYVTE